MRPSAAWMSALLAAANCSPVQAQSAAHAKRKELRDVQRQLEQKKREIDGYKKQADDLKHDLSKLAGETSESWRKIQALEDKIRAAESRKGEIKSRLGSLQLAEDQWHGVLAEEVNAYFRRELSQSDYFGRAEIWEESFRRAAILEKLRYVAELHGAKRKTEAAEAEARRQKEQLKAKTEQAKAEHQSRETLYQQKKEVYDHTQQKVSEARKAIKDLQDSALALTQLVRSLETKTPYKAKGGAIPLAEPHHSLPWPVDGRLASSFGKQQVPELHTWVINQGIRIATAVDAPVHPVKGGKVIFSGPFRSYGQVLIVDHGQAFYTIYGHMGRLSKKNGDGVNLSDTLGTAGQDGSVGALYFEIRRSGDALDPVIWLKRR